MNLPLLTSQLSQCLVATKYSQDELEQFADYEEETTPTEFLYRYTLLLHYRAKRCIEEYLKGNEINVNDFCVDWLIFKTRVMPILKEWGYDIIVTERHEYTKQYNGLNKIVGMIKFKLEKI